jgi:hypothetical protein
MFGVVIWFVFPRWEYKMAWQGEMAFAQLVRRNQNAPCRRMPELTFSQLRERAS